MRKIWIVLKSEFWRRARSKWFILSTLLGPVLLIGLFAAPLLLEALGDDTGQTLALRDESGRFAERLQKQAGDDYRIETTSAPTDSVRERVRAGDYDGYLVLPASLLEGEGRARYYSKKGGGISSRFELQDLVQEAVRQERLARQNTSDEVLAILEANVPVQMRQLTEEGAQADSTLVLNAVGYLMAFLIYMMVILYGQQIMLGVIEEKASRVVEVVVSSVRPFKLLMGKVLGIGALGLAQIVVWAALSAAGLAFAGPLLALFVNPPDLDLPEGASQQEMLEAAGVTIPTIPAGLVIWFALFFLGGYLLYASLFAAVGSAVEQQQDAQSLTFPIIMPLIIPIVMIFPIIEDPDSTMAVAGSLFPLFSSILMVLRVAVTSVPFWQTLLSFALLIATFVGAIWLSARIYRTGILMYGKKPSLGELLRWVRRA